MKNKTFTRAIDIISIILIMLLISSAFLLVISCTKSPGSINSNQTDNNINSDLSTGEQGEINNNLEENIKPLEKIDIDLVENNNGFAFELFSKLVEEDKDTNIFISPFSISTALAMPYNGASGQTKKDMAEVLNFNGLIQTELNEDFKQLLASIENSNNELDLAIANSVWKRKDLEVKQDFLDRINDFFSAEIHNLDFDSPDAPDAINDWIKNNTNGKIEKMIDAIDKDVIMYLINAIYFKGFWTSQFDEEKTEMKEFYLSDESIIKVSMMTQKAEFFHNSFEDFSLLKLPYGKNQEFAMYIVLPEPGESIDRLIYSIDLKKWQEIINDLVKKEVNIWIPGFKIDYGIKNLNQVLTDLGMGIAFSNNADFSGICKDIYISRVLHKALIEINEKGSEAAAATVVEMKCIAYEETPEFNANRPFFFAITDEKTDSILFMGKLENPSINLN